jgi:hypothetical protein
MGSQIHTIGMKFYQAAPAGQDYSCKLLKMCDPRVPRQHLQGLCLHADNNLDKIQEVPRVIGVQKKGENIVR